MKGKNMYQYKELYTIDFSEVRYYSDIHSVISKALDFPEYYGGNMSALWDCLTDMLGRNINIEIKGFDNLCKNFKEYSDKLLELFERLKSFDNGRYRREINISILS